MADTGPVYDIDSPALNKARRAARGGLMTLDRCYRLAYAEAVEKAVLAKQRALLKAAAEPTLKPLCASGTWHSCGEDIAAAIRSKQRAALAAAPARERKARTAEQWQEMYDAAMVEKRAQP